jgi:predicted NBD/HSP70 family sugar kinase
MRTKRQPLATDSSLLKQINYARILGLLRCYSPLSRAELARRMGVTRSTVTVITSELITEALIKESRQATPTPGGGRPSIGLELNPDGAFFIGAAIEADSLTVVELNLAAQVVQRVREPLAPSREPDVVLRQLVELIAQLQRANPHGIERLRGIGLVIQGTLNREGVVLRMPELDWQGVNLRQALESYVDLPLFVDNDANAAALAELYLGSAIKSSNLCSSLLYLLLNDGVGAGIIIHNRVFRGAYGTAGEVCDLRIEPAQEGGTDFGQSGSLGALVGRVGLLRRYRERGGRAETIEQFVERLVQDDPLARDIVIEWAQYLGQGLVSLVDILNPERVVLGGPLTVLLPYVEEQLRVMLRDCIPRSGRQGFFSNDRACFEISKFGEDSSAIGGAILVYQSLFQMPDLVSL